MRDRLIELILQSTQKCDSTDCNRCKYWNTNDCGAVRMADHLLKNGIIVPPCKVGDTVYYLEGSRILEGTVKDFSTIMQDNYFVVYVETKYSLLTVEKFGYWMFGKRIFLTHEEAEQALKERTI